MHSMKIKRPLPPLQKVTTKQVHNNHIYGYGRHTYEYNESAPAVELRITPQKSDSKAAQAERESVDRVIGFTAEELVKMIRDA